MNLQRLRELQNGIPVKGFGGLCQLMLTDARRQLLRNGVKDFHGNIKGVVDKPP